MASQDQIVLAFDAYGTLLSTESISKQLAKHFGEEAAASIAAQWRRYQLEYTWRLTCMKLYTPFSTVTRRALSHALSESGHSLSQPQIDSLMTSYNTLSLFPDAGPLFPALKAFANSFYPVIFSNGTKDMLNAMCSDSEEFAPHVPLFRDVVVVEEVGMFKPAPEVYRHLCEKIGKGKVEQRGNVWLISGNPFDVTGAKAFGMRVCWVDRSGKGWVDACMGWGDEGITPDVVVKGLGDVVEKICAFVKGES
ncbi:haloacid dehalogenase [Westerdykella ornata]|uniref:Haloacid dehalogenase n=1 Tax=Westerdykella ornata TaxID=318751 RepID=A0A6A6JPF7_WESOR|nr:haloacid dehalogenase [Westerdykella ornata]KAF2278412.1 haloacid dehalogenase [Westerdykella ornata]